MGAYQKPEYNGISFDSLDELMLYWWCEEAVEAGVISKFQYHPKAISLSDSRSYSFDEHYITPKRKEEKVRVKTMSLLAAHEYTPDFLLYDSKAIMEKKFQDKKIVVLDVKPSFDLHKNSSLFSVNQKWVMQKYGLYVHKVIVKKFFKANGISKRMRLTPTGKICATWSGFKTVEEMQR